MQQMQFLLDQIVGNISEPAYVRNYVRLIAGMQEAKTELFFAFLDFQCTLGFSQGFGEKKIMNASQK